MDNNYLEQYNKEIAETVKIFKEKMESIREAAQYVSEFINPLKEKIEQMREVLGKYDFSKLYDDIFAPIKILSLSLEEEKKDPDSFINYLAYVRYLSVYFWAMPYNIDTSELKFIFENVNSEKEFDSYMRKYFNKDKLESLFAAIKTKINRKHFIIFKQIEQGFYNKEYALINNAIISIIDDELSYYNYKKSDTKRIDILYPIIEDLEGKSKKNINPLDLFYLEMLNNNINVLFDDVNFNNIIIDNNKAVRRHTVQHGKKYSNQRIVSIMLLNTLYNLLYIKEDLKSYRKRLKLKKEKDGNKYYILMKKLEK